MANRYKSSFPIFDKYPSLVYLDNAATTQKPQAVIDRITRFYSEENSNIHRGVYDLSNQATDTYENVRQQVASFIGSNSKESIAFTKGTTESINIVARSFLGPGIQPGENIVVTLMEHHANLLPWQQLALDHQVELRVASLTSAGDIDMDALARMIDENTRMVAVTHISNTLGTINPIEEIITLSHEKGAPVLVDAAQSVAHYPLNVAELDCDFLTFSGHKMFGPFGVGVLYAHPKWIKDIHPYNYGGGMIRQVSVDGSTFSDFPRNLEAGTPNVAGVAGLGAAVSYIESLDRTAVIQHLEHLLDYAKKRLGSLEGVTLPAKPSQQSGIVSFTVTDVHPHDVASALNREQIAVRAGMHCTQPLLDEMGLGATVRASFTIYNSQEEIDLLAAALEELYAFWHD